MQNGEPADDAVRYETKTIQAVRGNVGRTITKWEQQGWEVVSRDDGALRSEVVLRKAKRTVDVRRYAIIGGAVAVVVSVVVAVSIVAGGGDDEPTAAAPTAPSSARSTPTPSPTTAPTTAAPSPSTAEDVITAENNPQFAAILTLGDSCSSDIASFAQQYSRRTVSFPASISALNSVAGTSTRYDIGIAPGDSGGESSTGPAFQFRDVNTTTDLNYTGSVPDSLDVGTLLDVTAEVGSYNSQQCLLFLDPVETSVR